jgi:alpha-mannosidase
VLHIELSVDWHEEEVLLKALFPTAHQGRFARYGSPYNSVLRGQLPGDPKDEAMFEVSASRWAVVMDDAQSEGLALLTEAKYGFSCRGGELGLSLLRAAKVTGEDIGHRKGITAEIRDGDTRPIHSDQGTHVLRYALAAFRADAPRTENPAALAELLYTPLLSAAAAADAGFIGLEGGESLIPVWSKPLPGGSWILRLHETLGRAGCAKLRLQPGWTASRTGLSEIENLPAGQEIPYRAYENVSLRLSPA